MSIKKANFLRIFVLASCLGLAGCIPHWKVDKPPGGTGYGIKSFWIESWEASGPSCSLHYWDARKWNHLIWSDLVGEWVLDNDNGIAVFNGSLDVRVSPTRVETWATVFAVEGSGPPVEISDRIKFIYFKRGRANRQYSLNGYSALLSGRTTNGFAFDVSNIRDDSGTVVLSVEETKKLIHDGQQKGQKLKDLSTGLPYLRENVVWPTQ